MKDKLVAFLVGLRDGLEGPISVGMTYEDLGVQDFWDKGANLGERLLFTWKRWKR